MLPAKRPKREPLMDRSELPIQPVTRSLVRKEECWFRSDAHLRWIVTNPCHYCARKPEPWMIQACHVRKGTDGAGGEKPSDYFTWPGCGRCHGIQGSMSEPAFHRDRGTLDPVRMALEYALRSTCGRTRDAAQAEFEKRYPNAGR